MRDTCSVGLLSCFLHVQPLAVLIEMRCGRFQSVRQQSAWQKAHDQSGLGLVAAFSPRIQSNEIEGRSEAEVWSPSIWSSLIPFGDCSMYQAWQVVHSRTYISHYNCTSWWQLHAQRTQLRWWLVTAVRLRPNKDTYCSRDRSESKAKTKTGIAVVTVRVRPKQQVLQWWQQWE